MAYDLVGKTALVTGSTAGIGYGIARKLLESGATVYVNGRSRESVDAAVARLSKDVASAKVHGVAGDVSTAAGSAQIFEAVPAVDILINNAGIFEPKPFFEIPDADWQRFFEVNVMSAIRMSRFYTPKMVTKGWGRVVFISSESAINIPTEMIHYGMTKTALLSISRGLAAEVAGTGVTVNSVLPGPTRTEGVEDFVKKLATNPSDSFDKLEEEFFRVGRPSSLLKRFATVDEVANMVAYVASKEASATTGSALRVDGGMIAGIQ